MIPTRKSKGRGKLSSFGPLKGKGKGKGKWPPFSKRKCGGGKSAQTAKGKDRMKLRMTGQRWKPWWRLDGLDWSTWSYTQLDWYDDWDYGWYDNWTWSSGSDCVGPSALSQPAACSSTVASSTSFTGAQSGTAPTPNVSALHSTVYVADLETGETLAHFPSRRTGTVTHPVRTGTGLLSAFVSVIAVMNSFRRLQGLPLIPETVSSPGVSPTDEYDDALGRHHENCISSLSCKEDWILFDSGAAAHCCPLDYAPELPVGKNPPRLRSVTCKPLNIIGRKVIRYDAAGVKLFTNYYVCDVPFCIVSVARIFLQDFCAVLSKDSTKLLTPL